MSRPGTCDTGCAEHKLVLVRAAAVDALSEAEATIRAKAAVLAEAAEPLLDHHQAAGDWELALRTVQEQARAGLQRARDIPTPEGELAESAEPTVTWWCDRCGGIDAPQPCLGICIWRTVEWARHDGYLEARERVLAARQAQLRRQSLLRRVAFTRPRPGNAERNWRAFARELVVLEGQISSHPGRSGQ